MTARFIVGDILEVLATIPDNSVDLIVGSPPFLALRSYLPADHPDKQKEIGSERTPGEFLDVLLDVVEACDRVLAPHGSLVFELGDTYANEGGPSGDSRGIGLMSPSRNGAMPAKGPSGRHGSGWPLQKSKCMIPQLFGIALAYGFNPLTGRETPRWRVRNVVAWCRPNPPVGRDGDKFRPATSFLTVACKARDRYWDGDAVRGAISKWTQRYSERAYVPIAPAKADNPIRGDGGKHAASRKPLTAQGAPLLDYWEIPTHPYKGAHYATWPPALVTPLVKSMAPRKVCRVCGQPSRRITGDTRYVSNNGAPFVLDMREGKRVADGVNQWATSGNTGNHHAERETLGWSDCGHGDWRRGCILDPFAGSGTTLEVASGHGLDCIGIDLDERNAELALERVGPLILTVEHHKERTA